VNLPRLARTLRHLRPAQAAAQLRHAIRPQLRPRRVGGPAMPWALDRLAARPPPLASHVHWDGARRLELVGQVGEPDWQASGPGPLFRYHLHFFEWARAASASPAARAAAIRSWVECNADGVGWDPHPISLRVLSWARLRFAEPGLLPVDASLDEMLRASLADQVETLAHNLEVRLQANHLLENQLAVVAGGLLLRGPAAERWLALAPGVLRELDAQLGPDGGHCERSPMYHALVLEHALDVLNIARAAGARAPASFVSELARQCARMLGAHAVWTHPDGEIALLGDAAFGIAQPLAELVRYGEDLGVTPHAPSRAGALRGAGVVRLESAPLAGTDRGPMVVIASVAGPSPPHQPGHAHCDALAFELSVGTERIVTDTGVYEYVPGERRALSRATRSHATLEIDGHEQSECWSGHRVGGRPRVELRALTPGRSVDASCAAWAAPRTQHLRRFEVVDGGIDVVDEITGPAAHVRAFLPLAPHVAPVLEGATARLGPLEVVLPSALAWHIGTAPWYPRFGVEQRRPVLLGEGPAPAGVLRWRFRVG